nr:MAG TPA: hypothetical protein [Caudoviricetes sp.]
MKHLGFVPTSPPFNPLFRTRVRCIIVAIVGLSYSPIPSPGDVPTFPVRVVPFILHLCIQVDLLRTKVLTRPRPVSSLDRRST